MKHAFIAGTLASLAAVTAPASTGSYYGLWWDGSTQHFVSLDPYTATTTSLATVPGVRYIETFNYFFDPDSSRYVFIGGSSSSAMKYHVVHAPTGAVLATLPKTDNYKNLAYSPRERKVYGLWWSDSTSPPDTAADSLGFHPPSFEGTEYFAALNLDDSTLNLTAIPGVKYVQANGHFLDSDSGRYVFAGGEGAGHDYFYAISTATGELLHKIPQTLQLNNPVYDAARGVVHGLWWSDSSPPPDTAADSLGFHPPVLQGTEYFVTIHPDSTVSMTAIPGVKYITMAKYALDTDRGRYLFVGGAPGTPSYYYVIDVETGDILSKTPVDENVTGIVYAPLSSTGDSTAGPTAVNAVRAEAPAWSARRTADDLTLSFANPSGSMLTLELRDAGGRLAARRTGIRGESVRLETSGLKAGIHVFTLRGAGVAHTGKLLIE